MKDKTGRERQESQNAGRKLPSQEGARTGRALTIIPPDHLKEHAKAWYTRAAELGNEMGIADEADADAYEAAAEIFQELREAQAHIEEHGMIVQCCTKRGETMVKNPAVGILQRARETLRLCRADLGLTPAARAKFSGNATKTQSLFEQLLGN